MEFDQPIKAAPLPHPLDFGNDKKFVDGDEDLSIETISRVRSFLLTFRYKQDFTQLSTPQEFQTWFEKQRTIHQRNYPNFMASSADILIGVRREMRASQVMAQYLEDDSEISEYQWYRTFNQRLSQSLEE